MKRNFTIIIIFIALVISAVSCKSKQQAVAVKGKPVLANTPVIVYKTKLDYSQHVPVIMSPDKQEIVSYPAPIDVFFNGDLAYPVALEDGYLLDKRGINENAAFTKWTYYEYSRLPKTPSIEEINRMMLETDPFIEMYHCGSINDFRNLEADLNQIIRKGQFKKFKKLK